MQKAEGFLYMIGEQKTAYLISCSDHYNHRLHVTDACLKKMGYKTVYITSDFDHTSKKTFKCDVDGCVQLNAKPYQKNLSVSRILSHRGFAKTVFKYIEQLPKQPDAIVALLPPNFLAYYGAKYKKGHPDVKLFFDIFDMWPETFPSGKAKKLLSPIFKIWAWIRDNNLNAADFIFTECEMFRNMLGLNDGKSATIYLCNEPLNISNNGVNLSEERIELCYLGAINNIISIPHISSLIKQITAKKPVTLHIIGTGEREQEFICAAKEAGAQVEFYGPVYDEEKKHQIISQCHFGLNIMKPSVCVGLTMKSVDYFRHGLPIINNIPADTQEFVNTKGIGLQVDDNCAEKLLALSKEDCLRMRDNVNVLNNTCFKKDVIIKQIETKLNKIMSGNREENK